MAAPPGAAGARPDRTRRTASVTSSPAAGSTTVNASGHPDSSRAIASSC
ncbi:hypothetical protein ACIO3R_25810 [Streptomyces sp. NPDC087428]